MRNCENCGHQSLTGECPVFQTKMSGETNCPHHQKQVEFCGFCGKPLTKQSIIDIEDDKIHFLCHACAEQTSRCRTCAETTYCALTDDKNCPLPLQVIKKVSPKPGVIMQTQVINPERIKVTCGNGCKCYLEGEEEFCIRRLPKAGCSSYKPNWKD